VTAGWGEEGDGRRRGAVVEVVRGEIMGGQLLHSFSVGPVGQQLKRGIPYSLWPYF
jgi:hypothetical protein